MENKCARLTPHKCEINHTHLSNRFQRLDSPKSSHDVVVKTVAVEPVPFEEENAIRQAVLKTSSLYEVIDQWWIWEIVALSVSFAALAGLIGMLAAVDGKPLPHWTVTWHVPHSARRLKATITINAILSIISTIMKIMMLIPVAAGLSQLKWNWFSEGHRLLDFQTFDQANQGPLGSLLLIWTLRGRRLACLGALITIGMLALDFAFQQVITYPIQTFTVQTKAQIPIASFYDQSIQNIEGGFDPGATGVVASMLGDIYTGTYNLQGKFETSPSCPTGNCTYTSYLSLGMCSQCLDATSEVTKSCSTYEASLNYNGTNEVVPYCNYSMPNGISLAGTQTDDSYFPTLNVSSSLANMTLFANLGTPVSVLTMLQADWAYRFVNGTIDSEYSDGDLAYPTIVAPKATQCALYACVKKYTATVQNGVLSEAVVGTMTSSNTLPDQFTNLTLVPDAQFANGTQNNGTSSFNLTSFALQGLQIQLGNYWVGNLSAGVALSAVTGTQPSSDLAAFLYTLNTPGQVDTMMSKLAASMTNNIRAASGEYAVGDSTKDVVVVVAIWGWLAVPATLLGLTLVFLAGTMWSNVRQGATLWKGSSLAAFYHPLTNDVQEQLGQAAGPRYLEERAKNMTVHWQMTDEGRRFVMS